MSCPTVEKHRLDSHFLLGMMFVNTLYACIRRGKIQDPACGSAHILVYAFDLLYQMYESEGYLPRDIPALILTKNLFGFEIDPRAAEIASFALEMKARAIDPNFFSKPIDPLITVLQPVTFTDDELPDLGLLAAQADLLEAFEHLDEIGSLYKPNPSDLTLIDNAISSISAQSGLFAEAVRDKLELMKSLVETLSSTFGTVIANPPYMPVSLMKDWSKKFIETNYKDYKGDLFACFVKRNLDFTEPNGQLGFMTPFVWMFITSYESLRNTVIHDATITSLVQLEYSGFAEATVPICTFTLQNSVISGYKGSYIRLSDFVGPANQQPKTLEAIANSECGWFYTADASDFQKIPGSPIAYWASPAILAAFEEGTPLGEMVEASVGIQTGNNDQFVRLWWEPGNNKVDFKALDKDSTLDSDYIWYPYNKGGAFRKWHGNDFYIINWRNDGESVKKLVENETRHVQDYKDKYKFKPLLTWSRISSGSPSFRYKNSGYLSDMAGFSFYYPSIDFYLLLGYLNSSVSDLFLKILCPTLNYMIGDILKCPLLCMNDHMLDMRINELVDELIDTSREDWDAFETSWDFERHPLVPGHGSERGGCSDAGDCTVEQMFGLWESECRERFDTLKANEEELNRIFARIYNMEGEVPIEVPDDKVSVRLADKTRDVKSLVSYAVGCMFGRYSADAAHPGLILADQGSTVEDYRARVGTHVISSRESKVSEVERSPEEDALCSANFSTKTNRNSCRNDTEFTVDEDGILPILDGEWFADDIVAQFKFWLEDVYGAETLSANVAFVEEALGKDLRTYFVKDFYDDHIKTYQKRPIYWMFSSPKKSFNVLVYMHRYDEGTVGDILTDYLRPLQGKLEASIGPLEASDRAADRKKADEYKAVLEELKKWETDVVYPMAHERIAIDLDDGVKVNYNKFPHALRKVTGLCGW